MKLFWFDVLGFARGANVKKAKSSVQCYIIWFISIKTMHFYQYMTVCLLIESVLILI